MKIQLTNPSDSFNLLEIVEFRYIAKRGQKSKKTLYIRYAKYKEVGTDFVYSDESDLEVFIADVDLHLYLEGGAGDCANALGACIIAGVKLLTEKGVSCLVLL